jgi:H+/Cl- antiporter ClcA
MAAAWTRRELPRGVDLDGPANAEQVRSEPSGLSPIEASGATRRIVAFPEAFAKLARMCAGREARPPRGGLQQMSEPAADPVSMLRSRAFLGLLVLAAVVGVVASVAAWGFLELIHQVQVGAYDKLPDELGFDHTPLWWPLPLLGIAGVLVAVAIVRLPGEGGHVPANGLSAGVTQPVELPGVLLAAVAGIGLGVVLGPEAPLIALGSGLGVLLLRRVRADAPDEVAAVMAAAGTFAALAVIFESPLIAAIIVIEAAGLGGARLPVMLVPGLLAAGIGSLVLVGMGSWTGLDTADIALGTLDLPTFARPDITDIAWTIPLAVAIAVIAFVVLRGGRAVHGLVMRRPFALIPAAALVVGGLAMLFAETTDKGVDEVLFSGQDSIGSLVSGAGSWSLSALALLIVFKGAGWTISLGSFRGGPVFPALFLGAAAGVMAAQLPGFSITPAVAVGMGAAVAAVLRLPLAGVVLAVLLTSKSGPGAAPLVILGVVVAFVTTQWLSRYDSDDGGGRVAPVEHGDHVLST